MRFEQYLEINTRTPCEPEKEIMRPRKAKNGRSEGNLLTTSALDDNSVWESQYRNFRSLDHSITPAHGDSPRLEMISSLMFVCYV